ncbi:MAG: hypothetical protein AAGC97_01620 [Planctomycetota bacterium]
MASSFVRIQDRPPWLPSNSMGLFVVLVCSIHSQIVAAADLEEVSFEFILDSDRIRFPEPIYGFIRLANVAKESTYMPSLGQLDSITDLTLHCGDQSIDGSSRPNSEPTASKKPVGYFSIMPFRFRYSSPEFVQRIREGFPCVLKASTAVRPAEISQELFAVGDTIDVRSRQRVPLMPHRLNAGNKMLTATAESRVKVDPQRWIFQERNDPLITIAYQPAAWRSVGVLREMTRSMELPESETAITSFFLSVGLIESLPILAVFPDRVDTIRNRVREDTATWRKLEISQVIESSLEPVQTPEQVATTITAIRVVLENCGPAELIWLEEYACRNLLSSLVNRSDRQAQQTRELVETFKNHWTEQLTQSFPGVPLKGLAMTSSKHERSQVDSISIEDLRRILQSKGSRH